MITILKLFIAPGNPNLNNIFSYLALRSMLGFKMSSSLLLYKMLLSSHISMVKSGLVYPVIHPNCSTKVLILSFSSLHSESSFFSGI